VIKKSILYLSEKSEKNTDETLIAAKERADELGIKDIVVASTRGGTGLKTALMFKGYNVVVVSHATGFREQGIQSLNIEMAEKIRAVGGKILTATHVFAGVDKAIRDKFDTVYPGSLMAQTLRLFGAGTKVAVEITAMAADAGMIPTNKDIIVIAGTGSGADTAEVIKPANSFNIYNIVIKEIIVKPTYQ
jgi:hypothetical protein